ncbi:hypothetical protein HDC92_004492 [Pedobacter sp. AK017]|uniref:DUF6266 family protein n=1 Tax=Pedobacter sp. AK017 TaxID=2723073 RepID=UPI00160FC4F5|nr:DUF6266 family protein [Pedobacter sp. AK017]MBB5440788.1 hypothetical protein [Pedobacter sp. AK017]
MGKFEDGIFGIFKGRIGNLVSYQLKGKNVIRRIGKTNKPPSLKQLTARQKMKVTADFLKPLLPFINVGFEMSVAGTDRHPHNEATAYIYKNALQGDYPNISIDYSKVLLSQGSLEPAINPQARLSSHTLSITWEVSPEMNWGIKNDRTMLLVYCPELHKAIYVLSGATRITGQDEIELPANYLGREIHLYIAFRASNGKNISNSVWLIE